MITSYIPEICDEDFPIFLEIQHLAAFIHGSPTIHYIRLWIGPHFFTTLRIIGNIFLIILGSLHEEQISLLAKFVLNIFGDLAPSALALFCPLYFHPAIAYSSFSNSSIIWCASSCEHTSPDFAC